MLKFYVTTIFLQALFQCTQLNTFMRKGRNRKSVHLANGSGSGSPKNIQIRIPNTVLIILFFLPTSFFPIQILSGGIEALLGLGKPWSDFLRGCGSALILCADPDSACKRKVLSESRDRVWPLLKMCEIVFFIGTSFK